MIRQVPAKLHPLYGIYMGWSMVILIFFVVTLGLMAFITQFDLLFWSASLTVAVFFVSIITAGLMINSLEVTKIVPDVGIVSRPLTLTYTIRNNRRYFPVYSVRIMELFPKGQLVELPRIYIPYLGPGKSCTLQILMTPNQRGELTCLGTRLASRYPFGLLTRFRTIVDNRTIMVYPALGTMTTHLLPANRASEYQVGITQPRYKGHSDEFYALREYRPGDNPRLIHWKRTARMGRLMIREMSQYSPHRLTVIMDTYLPDRTQENEYWFENMVSFTATVLCQSLEQGYRAALICSGEPPLMVPPLSGREAQHRILRILGSVMPQTTIQLSDLFRTWRFTGWWRGRCVVIGRQDPQANVLQKLSDTIGPVHFFTAGSADWRAMFIPPEYLRGQGADGHV